MRSQKQKRNKAKPAKPRVHCDEVGGSKPCDMDFALEQDAQAERNEREKSRAPEDERGTGTHGSSPRK